MDFQTKKGSLIQLLNKNRIKNHLKLKKYPRTIVRRALLMQYHKSSNRKEVFLSHHLLRVDKRVYQIFHQKNYKAIRKAMKIHKHLHHHKSYEKCPCYKKDSLQEITICN